MYFKEQILKELEGLPEFSCWEVWRDSHLADPPLLKVSRRMWLLVCCGVADHVLSWSVVSFQLESHLGFPFPHLSPSISLAIKFSEAGLRALKMR